MNFEMSLIAGCKLIDSFYFRANGIKQIQNTLSATIPIKHRQSHFQLNSPKLTYQPLTNNFSHISDLPSLRNPDIIKYFYALKKVIITKLIKNITSAISPKQPQTFIFSIEQQKLQFQNINKVVKTIVLNSQTFNPSPMILNQQPFDKPLIQQQQSLNQTDTTISQKRKPERKFSIIHQRVTQGSIQTLDSQRQQMRKNTLSKTKIHRRDTKETDLTISQISAPIQQTTEDSKMDELIKKSEQDPFLRRKLKNLMENDIKSLKRWNSKNPVTENHPNNTSMVRLGTGKKSVEQNTSQILDQEYKRIPKDISMVLIGGVLQKKNSSINDISVSSKMPPKPRNIRCSIEQSSIIVTTNPNTPKVQYTTLRRQSYKSNVSRLEMLREMEEKEMGGKGYVGDKFVDKTNLQNVAKLSKIGMVLKR